MMWRSTRAGHRAVFVLALALMPLRALAQEPARQPPPERPPRPTGALFDGARRPQRDIVSLSTQLYGGYDQELRGGLEPVAAGDFVRSGAFSGVDATLAYTPTESGAVDFNASTATSLRYYAQSSDVVLATTTGDAAASFAFGRRSVLQTRGAFAYVPYFDFPMVTVIDDPGALPLVPTRARDTEVSTRRIGTYSGGADYNVSLSERASIGAGYGIRRTNLLEEDRIAVDTTASAEFNLRLNRRTNSRVSYVHRTGDYGVTVADIVFPVRIDDLRATIDYDWNRSPTRRTTLTFIGGPSRVEQEGHQLTRATAGAGITHEFARSWDVRATYERGVSFLDTVARPVLSNFVAVNLSGLLTRELEVSIAADAILGEVGFDVRGSAYDTYTGTALIRYGLARRLAVYGEYIYSSLAFSQSPTPNENVPGQHRGGLRVGLSWYVPLVQEPVRTERPRRRGAARP